MSTTFPYQTAIPRSHLLADGEYRVLLTAAGSGFSQWKNCAITRWREDVTCEDRGGFVYLRDVESGYKWSAGFQPLAVTPDEYAFSFEEGAARIERRDGEITTTLDVIVDEGGVELRRITLANLGRNDREIELTTYSELVLAPANNDASHPAFSKIFVQTDFDQEKQVLLASRRPRTPTEQRICVAQWLQIVDKETGRAADLQFETDRVRFIGRGGTLRSPAALADNSPLSGTVGTVLDPIFSLRQRLRVDAGESVTVLLVTVAAETRDEVMAVFQRRRHDMDFDALLETAKQRSNDALGGLGIDAGQASRFQRMANALYYSDSSMRAPADQIVTGQGGGPTLWSGGISGDNPIVLLNVHDTDGLTLVDAVLTAQSFWSGKGLTADVVVIGDGGEALQKALKQRVEDEKMQQGSDDKPHTFALAAGIIADDLSDGLRTVARIVLDQAKGSLEDHVSDLSMEVKYSASYVADRQEPIGELASVDSQSVMTAQVESRPLENSLERYNGYGGYDRDGREFVTIIRDGVRPPMPWLNVIANPKFGFTATEAGSGYCWAINSQKNTLTPWANDPAIDPPNGILYVRDRDDGVILTATALPGDSSTGDFVARHGQGYSRFQRKVHGIELDLLEYIPVADSVKISRLTLRNRSGRPRRFSVTAFVHWSLGGNGSQPEPFVNTELDTKTGALFASNRWREHFADRVAFIDLRGQQTSHSGDRQEFLGRHGSLVNPLALSGDTPLSGNVGAGIDPCGALQTTIELADDEEREIVLLLGDADGAKGARELVERYRNADLDTVYSEATGQWNDILGTVQVRTPDRGMDLLLNGWLLYQALACRIWARTGYYQSSGAYGFRDQLQDVMAVCVSRPDIAREHLLRAAGRQFVEGDVQHWWLPPNGGGVRTRMTDDRLWLPYVLCHYVDVTNDTDVLDERQTFLAGDALKEGQDEAYFTPENAEEDGSIYEHCARAIDVSLDLGEHGIPLIGTGDWNDGMNRVGEKGKGESVWLGWFLVATIDAFAPIAEARGDDERAKHWRKVAASVRKALDDTGWDGDWYRRGYYDDCTPLGSHLSSECKIDTIAQSWSVIAGGCNPQHAQSAMDSVDAMLIRRDDRVAPLFTPPFDCAEQNPGYIKAYPPGIRENGGQYTHGSQWSIFALAKMGQGNRAEELFSLINPANHSDSREAVERYKVEPYVACADVYSVEPHVGRGGWTWYTGSGAWLYRAGLEAILGFQVQGDRLLIDPSIPETWREFQIHYRHGRSMYEISVENPRHVQHGVVKIEVNGEPLPAGKVGIPLVDDGLVRKVIVTMGHPR